MPMVKVKSALACHRLQALANRVKQRRYVELRCLPVLFAGLQPGKAGDVVEQVPQRIHIALEHAGKALSRRFSARISSYACMLDTVRNGPGKPIPTSAARRRTQMTHIALHLCSTHWCYGSMRVLLLT